MDSLLGEHFQCAMRNLIFFGRVILISVVLSLAWNNNLDVTLWAEGSAFKEWLRIDNTP